MRADPGMAPQVAAQHAVVGLRMPASINPAMRSDLQANLPAEGDAAGDRAQHLGDGPATGWR